MAEIVRLEPGDHEDAVDFLNLVFGADHPHDFERMLPLCYRPPAIPANLAIREGGKIRAMVGRFDRSWVLGEHTLRVGAIGGVSTHPKARGRGHMQSLMAFTIDGMQRDGLDLSWLGGQRQRYAHFGYEVGGMRVRMHLEPNNVAKRADGRPVKLERVYSGHRDWLDAIHTRHEAWPLRHPDPRADLFGYLTAWHSEPWVALDDGAVVGWLVARQGRGITELGVDEDRAVDVIAAWMGRIGRNEELVLSPHDTGVVRRLGAVAESQWVQHTGNWRIFRWDRVLPALLALRAAEGPVVPGSVVLGIEGAGAFAIACDGTRFEVEPRPLSDAAWTLDPLAAVRALLGPVRPSQAVTIPGAATPIDQWCPLPAFWAPQDGV